MQTTGIILIPTVSANHYDPGYLNYNANVANNWAGEPQKAASYYRTPGGLQTVAYSLDKFSGNLIFEGTLDSVPNSNIDPGTSWFTIADVSGLGKNTYLQATPSRPTFKIQSEMFYAGQAQANSPYAANNLFQLNGAYPADQLIVSVDGMLQIPGTGGTSMPIAGDYYTVGQTLGFNNPLLANSFIEVREFYEPISTTNFNSESFVANGASNTFILQNNVAAYTTNSVIVSVNGLVQIPVQGNSLAPTVITNSFANAWANAGSGTGNIYNITLGNTAGLIAVAPPVYSFASISTDQNPTVSANIIAGTGAQILDFRTDGLTNISNVLLQFPTPQLPDVFTGNITVTFPQLGSYLLTSTGNANANVYTNTLQFDWTPLLNDIIEVREIVGGDLPIPPYTGIGAVNLSGNFTWVRCRVENFRTGTIKKVTMSY